jgi:hypothetical protein
MGFALVFASGTKKRIRRPENTLLASSRGVAGAGSIHANAVLSVGPEQGAADAGESRRHQWHGGRLPALGPVGAGEDDHAPPLQHHADRPQ